MCVPLLLPIVSVEPLGIVRPEPVTNALFHCSGPVIVTPLNVIVPLLSANVPPTLIEPTENVESALMSNEPLPVNVVPFTNVLPLALNLMVVPQSALKIVVADVVIAEATSSEPV